MTLQRLEYEVVCSHESHQIQQAPSRIDMK